MVIQGFIYIFAGILLITLSIQKGIILGLGVALIVIPIMFICEIVARKVTGDNSKVYFGGLFAKGEETE